jgi:hypothetical protein
MQKLQFGKVMLFLTTLILSAVGSLLGQSNQGSIAGNVLDSTGAAVPHAGVVAKNRETGFTSTAESSAAGSYRLPAVPLGSYDVSVQMAGFKAAHYSGVLVQVNTVSTLDITLEVGSSSEQVTVEASAPSVQSESSEVGFVVTTKQVIELPLALGGVGALRSPEAFVFLQPGTIGPGTQNTANGIRQIKIGGAQNQGMSILVDGLDQLRSENASFFDEESPSVEAIQEFKLTISNPSAEYGRTTGAVESFATKSGTNAFHGSAFDIFRNEALDANNYFNNGRKSLCLASAATATAIANCNGLYRRPSNKQNDYGISLGGPVFVPHLYDGRQRSFFFFSWEQFRQSTGGPVTSTVPSNAMRNGDFSALLTSSVVTTNPCDATPVYNGQIFDPSTTRTVNGVQCRTAFPGNIIPSGRITTIARNYLNYYPLPQSAGTFNNYTINQPYPITNTTYTVRIDNDLTAHNKLFGSWTARQNTSQKNPRTLPDPVDPNQWNQNFVTHLFRFGLTTSVNVHVVNQFLMGLNRTNAKNFSVSAQGNINYAQQLGISNINAVAFPITTVGESIPVLNSGNNGDPVDNGLRFADTVSIEHGHHYFKFGGDYRYQQLLTFNGPIPRFTFARAQTAGTSATIATTNSGNGFASLLLGLPSSGSINVYSSQPRWLSAYWAVFFQDDYKIRPNLTLNLGVRYDVDLPRRESRNRTSNFSETAIDPASGRPGALVFGTNCNCNAKWIDPYFKDISPRIGFAYSPNAGNGKSVLRGSYSILYAPLFYADGGTQMNTGYKANAAFNSVNAFSPAFDLAGGFPAYSAPPLLNPSYFEGQVVASNYIRRNMNRPAMTQQWNLEVQQELAPDLIFTLGYLGQRGNRLRSNLENINNIPKSAFQLGDNLARTLSSNTAGVTAPFGTFYSVFGNSVQTSQALRPFPQYQQIQTNCCLQNDGQSTYHALLASLQRRFRSGTNLQVSYTWSKNITNSDTIVLNTNNLSAVQDPTNLKGEKSVSTQDLPNVFVTSFIQELPFGRSRRYFNHGIASYLAGGWQVGAVLRYQSGTPVSFGCASSIPGWDNCVRFNQRPGSSFRSAAASNHSVNPFLVTSKGADPAVNSLFNLNVARDPVNGAFVDPNASRNGGPYQLGTIARVTNAFRMNGYKNEDFSIIKNTPLTEKVTFQLKFELLNGLNRHAFGVPSVNPTDNLFGVPTTTLTTARNSQITARLQF